MSSSGGLSVERMSVMLNRILGGRYNVLLHKVQDYIGLYVFEPKGYLDGRYKKKLYVAFDEAHYVALYRFKGKLYIIDGLNAPFAMRSSIMWIERFLGESIYGINHYPFQRRNEEMCGDLIIALCYFCLVKHETLTRAIHRARMLPRRRLHNIVRSTKCIKFFV